MGKRPPVEPHSVKKAPPGACETPIEKQQRRVDELKRQFDALELETRDLGLPQLTSSEKTRLEIILDQYNPEIMKRLNQPFGKEKINCCFYLVPSFRHILLPLWKSRYLTTDEWSPLANEIPIVGTLTQLLLQYGDTDFRPLQRYNPHWKAQESIDQHRVAMNTAALLAFDGDAASTVRFIGGPHVAAHRDTDAILANLRRRHVTPSVIAHLERIFRDGIPAYCNATSTEANYQAFSKYGNHKTVLEDPKKAYKALLKDFKKDYILLYDRRLVPYLLHSHVTPQGIVDLDTPFKNPRPVFDSSFRPQPWCFAINDWQFLDKEPPVGFGPAEVQFMTYLCSLRAAYPTAEIYIIDDDVSGAFRQVKYNPNMVAVHTTRQCGYGGSYTGGAFGDMATPSNFDPIRDARCETSQHMWLHDDDLIDNISPLLPPITMAPPPTVSESFQFTRADRDPLFPAIFAADGSRLPPQYNMHVDDCFSADVREFLPRTVCASAGGLFEILGYPDPLVPPCLSMDKLETSYSHLRKCLGRQYDSRRLTVGMLPYKREQLLQVLQTWLHKPDFNLLELASLLGILDSHTRYCPWGRPWFFCIQNAMRRCLTVRYHLLRRIDSRFKKSEKTLQATLPSHLGSRIQSLIAKEKAAFLWTSRARCTVPAATTKCIQFLFHYVSTTKNPWETPLPLVVPRTPHFESFGDASHTGGGAYFPSLRIWFDIIWSKDVHYGATQLKSSDPNFVHINSLEFVVLIVQLAAIITFFEDTPDAAFPAFFPLGRPHFPAWLGWTDNMTSKSWESRATTKSHQGQGLIEIYAALLERARVHTRSAHIPGVRNVVADDISRNDFSLPFLQRHAKLCVTHPFLKDYRFFLLSRGLRRLISYRLFSGPHPRPTDLPKNLGRLVPAPYTISHSQYV
jgi:hypothetical protein